MVFRFNGDTPSSAFSGGAGRAFDSDSEAAVFALVEVVESFVGVPFSSNILIRSIALFSLGPLTGLGGRGNLLAIDVTEMIEVVSEEDEIGSVCSDTLSSVDSNVWKGSKLGEKVD